MSGSLKYFQLISFFGTLLLGLLSLFALNNAEFLKLAQGTQTWSALCLFLASLFYLVVFGVCTLLLNQQSSPLTVRDSIKKKIHAYGVNPEEVREDNSHLLNRDNKIIN